MLANRRSIIMVLLGCFWRTTGIMAEGISPYKGGNLPLYCSTVPSSSSKFFTASFCPSSSLSGWHASTVSYLQINCFQLFLNYISPSCTTPLFCQALLPLSSPCSSCKWIVFDFFVFGTFLFQTFFVLKLD